MSEDDFAREDDQLDPGLYFYLLINWVSLAMPLYKDYD